VELLIVAFYLSILTYYLGVLIKMIPIPIYGLKKWSSQLMVDGVFSAILVFSYSTIKWLITYIGSILGVDWDSFYSWFYSEVTIVIGLIFVLKTIGIGLSTIGLDFLAKSIVSPLVSSLTYLLLFLFTSVVLISILITVADKILALGLILHAIPFRITRASGSSLIALVIVFSIGTPLLPQFISLFPETSRMPSSIVYGYCLANIYVFDHRNMLIPYYLFETYSIDSNELLARYSADSNGIVNATSFEKGIPSSEQVVYIKLAGYYYRTVINPKNQSSIGLSYLNISFKTDNLIILRPIRFVSLFNYSSLDVLSFTNTSVYYRVVSSENSYFIVVGYLSDNIYVYVNNTFRQPSSTLSYEWGGCYFKAYKYSLPEGVHYVYVIVNGNYFCKPYFEEKYYARDTLGLNVDEIVSITYPVSILVFKLFIAPVVYLGILLSATVSLSRLLGGSSPRIIRVMVSGV